jgi:hypothetical protein
MGNFGTIPPQVIPQPEPFRKSGDAVEPQTGVRQMVCARSASKQPRWSRRESSGRTIMQLVRNGIVILVLVGVGYAVYTYVNKPEQTPPPGIDTEIPALAIDMGTGADPGTPVDGLSSIPALPDSPPAHFSGRATDDAPRFGDSSADSPAPSAATLPPASSLAPPVDALPDSRSSSSVAKVAAAKGSFTDAWQDAQRLLGDGKLLEAHALLSAWYGNPDLAPADELRLVELLGKLAGTIIYAKETHLLEQAHITRENETLKSIADQYGVPARLLAKINGIDEQQPLRPGEKLKVVRGPFDAVVDLQRKEVSLLLRGQYAGRFKIVRTGVRPDQFKNVATELQVKEKSNVRGEHLVGLERNFGIYAEDYSENALKMPAESSIVLSVRDAEDVYDILTYGSRIAVAP